MFVNYRYTYSDYNFIKVFFGNVNKLISMYFYVFFVFKVKIDLLVMEMFEVYVFLWIKMI